MEPGAEFGRFHFRGGTLIRIEGASAPGDLYLEAGRIAAVTPDEPAPDWPRDTFATRELSGRWILPGFVQTHVHLCQTLFRGAAERRDLYHWLSEVIWPLEAALDERTMEISAEAGIRELLAGGTTCVLDMGTTRHTEAILKQASALGIRGMFGPALMDRGPSAAQPLLRSGAEALREVEELASRWQGHRGRIGIALCPRFVPSVTDQLWRDLSERTSLAQLPVHTHGSETHDEVNEVRKLTGLTPPAYLAGLAGAKGRVKMAHGVWLEDSDLGLMSASGACVTHCPGSNFKLGSGTADVLRMRRAGIGVGLGADGAACNNLLSAWQEMRLAGYVRSLLHGPPSVSAVELLRMATLDGAAVLGLEREIGSLKSGKRADLVVVDPRLSPASGAGATWESPEDFLVHAGGAELVEETWVEGRCVFRRGEDTEAKRWMTERVTQARRSLAERAGLASSRS